MPKLRQQLAKCKHPNSRKLKSVTKNVIRKERRNNVKLDHLMKQNVTGEKLLWFRDNSSPDITCYTSPEFENLIQKYLDRFDKELEQIKIKRSVGGGRHRTHQHASRENVIKMTIERERQEFETCGLDMVDMTDKIQLSALRLWNGELKYLQNFKLVRIKRKQLQQMILLSV